MTEIYAIVQTGGKQYRVVPNQTLDVERLDVSEGDTVELDKVLFIGGEGDALVGSPVIGGARVVATSLGEAKGDKVIVFKYKNKIRYRNKRGHRQTFTRLMVKEIVKG